MARYITDVELKTYSSLYDYYVCKDIKEGNLISIRFVEDYSKGLRNILIEAGYICTFVGCRAIQYTHPDYAPEED